MMKALTLLLTLTLLLSSVLALAKKVADEPERPNIPVDYTIDMVQFVVGDKNTTNFGKEWLSRQYGAYRISMQSETKYKDLYMLFEQKIGFSVTVSETGPESCVIEPPSGTLADYDFWNFFTYANYTGPTVIFNNTKVNSWFFRRTSLEGYSVDITYYTTLSSPPSLAGLAVTEASNFIGSSNTQQQQTYTWERFYANFAPGTTAKDFNPPAVCFD